MKTYPLRSRLYAACVLAFCAALPLAAQPSAGNFQRIATFPIFENFCAATPADQECVDTETVAEIVAASTDGETLIYTDSETEHIGFIDISDPENPMPGGLVALTGEPTSVAVVGDYALAAVNTSADFVDVSGHIAVIDIEDRAIVATIPVDGQPDSIATGRTRRFAALVLENERNEDICVGGAADGTEDEDLCEDGGGVFGGIPQLPAGSLVILDMIGRPASWTTRTVELTGLAAKAGSDPEPEYVDISSRNQAVITMQENNHLVIVDLPTGRIVNHFSAGTVDLDGIDVDEEGLITLESSLDDVPREPDAVTWISPFEFATADEGDLDGGSRGFTIFRADGGVRYASGLEMEYQTVRAGHYPEERSGNKGNEPEGVEFGLYGSRRLLFVGSERSSVIGVYELPVFGAPQFVQLLPAGVGPEGLLAIPKRNLFVVASEVDGRGDKIRSSVGIYRLEGGPPAYPTIVSENRGPISARTPIPWGALSALAADRTDASTAYAVYDSFYKASRIFVLDVSSTPARITREIVLRDSAGDTLDLDPEGLATRADGGFWLASEGAGSVDDEARPVVSKDVLVQVAPDGRVMRTVNLPASVDALQRRFGFEGVASVGSGDSEVLYVAFQREWVDDPDGLVRIGRYEVASGAWSFYYYRLDPATSPNGGWVGLSEIVAIDADNFAVIERDNQGGPDAAVKRIYEFNISRAVPQPQGGDFPILEKTLVRDILPDLEAPGGLPIEKVEGLTILKSGDVLIVTDNDGVDDSSGETQLINLGPLF